MLSSSFPGKNFPEVCPLPTKAYIMVHRYDIPSVTLLLKGILLFIVLCFNHQAFVQTNRDEAAFRYALKSFQSAVLQKNLVKAGSMMHSISFNSFL
ncbi:hypothetical protein SAMN05443550_10112 [Pedobacter hartonius]|uniref:Uncharacterized protein n=1 Tax=Pedobacter hartonius TaxID=425514 RepID=A0A1H3VYB0_9SPHI|nr:hypothetical protein SAMN05443550_10112 [Pedobacter hartonius]